MRKTSFHKDTDIREYRRKIIVRLSEQTGLTQEEIATLVECTQRYVSEVLKAYHESGEESLQSVPHPGAESKLDSTDLQALKKILGKGAKAQGYDDDL